MRQSFKLWRPQFNSDNILVNNRGIWDLLGRGRINFINVFDELDCHVDVFEVERSVEFGAVFIDLPVVSFL